MAVQYTSVVLAQFDTNLELITGETPDAGFKASGYRFDLDKEPDSAVDGTYYLDVESVSPHARNWGTGEAISECIVVLRIGYFRGGGDKNEGDRQSVLRNAADDGMRIADVCENPDNYNAATTGIREIRYQGSARRTSLPRSEIWEHRFWVQWRSDLAIITGGASDVSASLVFDNNAAMAAYDTTNTSDGVIARVLTYRDFFLLDRLTARTVVADNIVAALGGGYWVRMYVADPFWATQGTWAIDPVGGSDEAAGGTLTPLKTRSEFWHRLNGSTLAQNTTITVASDLASTDVYIGRCNTGFQSGFGINWVGTPTSLFSGTITAYTARSGSGAQPTLMTIASIPVSWTASGLLDKIIEYDNGAGGFVRATVVADMGSKTAWISPPINQNNTQDSLFVVGQTVNVYEMPSLGIVSMRDQSATYKYCKATRWEMYEGRSDCTNCTGPVNVFGGVLGWINCHDASGNITINYGRVAGYSGKNRYIGAGGTVFIKAHACVTNRGLQSEGAGIVITGGQGAFPSAVPADIEFYSTSATGSAVYLPDNQGGRVICGGYVYGSSVSTSVVEMLGRDATASFTRVPAITGATTVKFALAGTTPAISAISSQELRDAYNNRVIGPFGPQ